MALDVSQVVVSTSGSGPFAKITLRLNGPGASNVSGTYSAGANTLTFTGLAISVANGGSETYTVNAYYNDTTSLTDNQTLILSIDGDTGLVISSNSTQMSGANTAISNGTGTAVSITATQLVLDTVPADARQVNTSDEVVSRIAFQTQPVIRAHDGAGNLNVDFIDSIAAGIQSGSGQLDGTTSVATNAVIATVSNLRYDAAIDGGSFVLSFDDQASGSEGNIPAITEANLNADVVVSLWEYSLANRLVSSAAWLSALHLKYRRTTRAAPPI